MKLDSYPVTITWQVQIEGLAVEADVLDTGINLGSRDRYEVHIELRGDLSGGLSHVPVHGVLATVHTTTDRVTLATAWDGREPSLEDDSAVTAIRTAGALAMEAAVSDFVDHLGLSYGWARARVRDWPLAGVGKVAVAGVEANFGGPPAEITVVSRERGASATEVNAISHWLRHGSYVGVGWKLFLDARRRWEHDADARTAVVEAAVAVEVGATEALRYVAIYPDLLEFALRGARTRDRLTTLSSLILGVSFADQDKQAYDDVLTLAEARNGFLHRGELPDAEAVPGFLEAARRALAFFNFAADQRALQLGYKDDLLFDRLRGK